MGGFSSVRNWIGSFTFGKGHTGKRSLNSLIAAFQFTRLKHDIRGWREALSEMEQGYYPHRVKAQRIFIDTVINPHVHACLERSRDLVLLKEYGLFSGDTCDEDQSKLLRADWTQNLMRYALEAREFGYSLISLGDMINNAFPHLTIVPRENVSPDREIVSPLVYQINGEKFNDPSSEFYNWCIWVTTPSDKGTSPCGYGLLYKIANLEIFLRNLLGSNANYNDKYGQPLRRAKTSKLEGKEYDELEAFLRDAGENGYIIHDHNDEVDFITPAAGQGQGFKTYDNFETRLEKKISKVILGHADALDSTPGKLGAADGLESAVAQALEDLETKLCTQIENLFNDQVIPKLIAIGFPIKQGLVFKFKNDKEKEEIREKQDKSLQATATAIKTLSDAGFEVSEKWLSDHTGIEITKKEAPEPPPLDAQTQQRLKNIYNGGAGI